MAKHFVIFIHGVNVRERSPKPDYADNLIKMIQQSLPTTLVQDSSFIPLYWGDVNIAAETELDTQMEKSSIWKDLALQDVRSSQAVQFVGDAALYISRDLGSLVVDRIKTTAFGQLSQANETDLNFIHLVTHSWGTIILFDILFASRWDDPTAPGYSDVQAIRDVLFGIGPNPTTGFYLGSITTMGSPIALFSLMSEKFKPANAHTSTHDVTTNLSTMLANLKAQIQSESYKMNWQNQMHPCDLIAWPIETLIDSILPNMTDSVSVSDNLVDDAGPWKIMQSNLYTGALSIPDAHGSYWESHKVAASISNLIQAVENGAKPQPSVLPQVLKKVAVTA